MCLKLPDSQPVVTSCTHLLVSRRAMQAAQVRKASFVPDNQHLAPYDPETHHSCTVHAGTYVQQVWACHPLSSTTQASARSARCRHNLCTSFVLALCFAECRVPQHATAMLLRALMMSFHTL